MLQHWLRFGILVLPISRQFSVYLNITIYFMNKLFGAILVIAFSALALAFKPIPTGKWVLDPSHSNIKFSVSHLLVSETEGTFKISNASVLSDKPDFTDAVINFDIDINSINTDNADRDKHLKSEDFFDAAKFPKATFVSTSFSKVKGNNYKLVGDLTIHGVTKKAVFNVIFGGIVNDPWKNTKAGFKATTKINRFDYGLKWNTLTEAGGAVVGKEVSLVCNIELKKS